MTSRYPISNVRLKQKGVLRTKQNGKWMPFVAEQYFTIEKPAFLWLARINTGFIHIAGRDRYSNGNGSMVIKAASIISLADAKGREIDQGSLLRFLAEIQWFPSAALSPYITWVQTADNSANATLNYHGLSVSGTFCFNDSGDVISFEAFRYMDQHNMYSLEKWYVPVTEYKVYDGIRIPSKGKAIWKLKTGDFNWFEWEIVDISYDTNQAY